MLRPIGVVLAGGASSRMGSDKAVTSVAGRPMSTWVLDALATVCDDVLVAGRPDGLGDVRGIADPVKDRRGPLSGLVGALEQGGSAPILLVATDQPWVRSETLRGLAELSGELPVVPIDHDGIRQTTCAVFPPGILSVALDELLAGGSIQSVLDRTAFDPVEEDTWRAWGEDGRSWFSADTPEAVAEGIVKFGPPGPQQPM
jgi:molybdopterin-guanine dinucleotide biosynthesis protein A